MNDNNSTTKESYDPGREAAANADPEREAATNGGFVREAEEIYARFKERSSKDDEFNDWEGYRAQLTEFVVRNTRPGSSLLILGAGKCNDLDLNRLAEHCGTITLSDYRPETAEEALRQYGLDPSDKLQFLESDYVGITDEDYIRYTALLIRIMEKLRDCPGSTLESIAGCELRELQDELERIYRDNEAYEVDLGGSTYDNVVVAGVHSQLNNSFRGIFQYARKDAEEKGGPVKYQKELNAAIFESTRKHTLDLVRRFNNAVFAAAKDGIIYGYEKRIIYIPEEQSAAGGIHSEKQIASRGIRPEEQSQPRNIHPEKQTPVIGTVDGARQAGEEIEKFDAADQMGCLWPLSRRRGIKFEMDIRYLPSTPAIPE